MLSCESQRVDSPQLARQNDGQTSGEVSTPASRKSSTARIVESPLIAARALNALLRSPLRTPNQQRRKRSDIRLPPPLCLKNIVDDQSAANDDYVASPLVEPSAAEVSASSTKDERRFKLKFRLPPVIRKKRSCPSLFEYNNACRPILGGNNMVEGSVQNPRTQMISDSSIAWIHNPITDGSRRPSVGPASAGLEGLFINKYPKIQKTGGN